MRRGIISEWTARNVFQIALADESVVESATERRRAETRERRVERGRPYEEFVADWEQRQPPEDALEYYGEWPVAMTADAPLATVDGGEESAERRDE